MHKAFYSRGLQARRELSQAIFCALGGQGGSGLAAVRAGGCQQRGYGLGNSQRPLQELCHDKNEKTKKGRFPGW